MRIFEACGGKQGPRRAADDPEQQSFGGRALVVGMLRRFKAAAEKAEAAEIAKRLAHLDTIKKLDAEAEKHWVPQEKLKAEAPAQLREAEYALTSPMTSIIDQASADGAEMLAASIPVLILPKRRSCSRKRLRATAVKCNTHHYPTHRFVLEEISLG